jgi:hypothetical protein
LSLRLAKKLALAAGACGLAVGTAGSAGITATTAAAALGNVIVQPGIKHIGAVHAAPTTTAQCEQLYGIAC